MDSKVDLLIKFPTRSRPDKFKKTIHDILANLSRLHTVQIVVSADEDDETMNNDEIKGFCHSLPIVDLCFNPQPSTKISACNANMENRDFLVVLLISDDFVVKTESFDIAIMADMTNHFPDLDGVIDYWDGYRKKSHKIVTIPVMGKKFYDRFGYIYNPLYKSLFCDDELYEVSYRLGKYLYSDSVMFYHDHAGQNPDDLYKKNSKFEVRDKLLFLKRKQRKFDLDV